MLPSINNQGNKLCFMCIKRSLIVSHVFGWLLYNQ